MRDKELGNRLNEQPIRKLIRQLFREISLGMMRDQEILRRDLQRVQRNQQKGHIVTKELASLRARLTASRNRREKRLATLPTPLYPADLPVAQQREQIANLIHKHPVVVLCGETGSGKTTQLPKICLDLQRGASGWIGITQPRRIAAHSIANYLAKDLGSEMGGVVGYKMRFNDRVSPDSFIKVMTDGILLAEIQSDRLLSHYDTLIIDEAHERSLNIDFILGYLKQLIRKRPNLKVIISSATLDTQRFAKHFNQQNFNQQNKNAPIIEVSGRTFPVETRYRPLFKLEESEEKKEEDKTSESSAKDLEQGIFEAVEELYSLGPSGDILVFLPGEREIREVGDYLNKHNLPHTEVLPLFARLSMANQQRIFYPGKQRRIILATNVAETSITVPGIRYVIDSGLARISRHSGRTQVHRLPVEKISQAASNQRQGRCGRLADGVCIRLFSKEDFLSRPVYTDPEILRSSLAAVILQMKFLKLGSVEHFPFVDPPNASAVKDGLRVLSELGAVDFDGNLSKTGRELAQLPLEPRLGRMILAGETYGSLTELLIIVSAMSIPDPREWPIEQRGKAEAAHKRHLYPHSDFMGLLNIWTFIQAGEQAAGSKNQFRRYLKENFLSFIRVKEWMGIHDQLCQLVKQLGMKRQTEEAGYREVHQAVLSGSLGFIGLKSESHDYIGVRQTRCFISPGSVLFKKSPTWMVAGELTETTRLFASTCAKVEPEWIEEAAGHLCRKHHFDPHWEKKSGAAVVFERVTLFGLTLIAQRKVQFGPIDSYLAREIFIQSALVDGQLQTTAEFMPHNQGLVAEVRELEHKSRRRDLLVDEKDRVDFYDKILPEHVHNTKRFHQWYWQKHKKNNRLLFFHRDMLLRHAGEGITGESFPGHLRVHGQELPLEYHFNPGEGEDGISVRVPLPYLNQLPAPIFGWLVPGLLPNKISALLKSLPKSYRRALVPLPQASDYCMENIGTADRDKPLEIILARLLLKRYGITIPMEVWRTSELPDHLQMNFKVVLDENSDKVVAQGRDLAKLQQQQGQEAKKSFSQLPKADFERSGISQWDFGELPQQVAISTKTSSRIYGFPAIKDDGKTVSLRLLDDPHQARRITRWGLVRLFALQLRQQIRHLENAFGKDRQLLLAAATLGSRETVLQGLISLTLAKVFIDCDEAEIHTAEQFQQRLQAGRGQLSNEAKALGTLARSIFERYQEILAKLRTLKTAPGMQKTGVEIRSHLDTLVFPGFLQQTPLTWLKQYPRYLQAILLRLERRTFAPQKDQQRNHEIIPLWQQYRDLTKKQAAENIEDLELQHYRWMLEEYRVSLFAQDLRTSIPVSTKRLNSQWLKVLQ